MQPYGRGGVPPRREVECYLADIFAAGCGPSAKLFDIARGGNLLPTEDIRAIGASNRILGAMEPPAIVTSDALRPTAETFVSYAAASRSIRLFEGERDARSWLQTQLGSRAGR